MKIRRYVAPDARQAIRRIRAEQGPDAVIVSNRRVEGGVEILVAVDYDEAAGATAPRRDQPRPADKPPQSTGRGGAVAGNEASPRALWTASAAVPALRVAPAKRRGTASDNPRLEWSERCGPTENSVGSQHAGLAEMRRELKDMRAMLENQLAGFAWGDLARRHPGRLELLKRLSALGLSRSIARQLVDEVDSGEDVEPAWRRCLDELTRRLPVSEPDIVSRGGILALVGPTGVGKTTSIAKLAARFIVRNGTREVAFVTTDSYRIGAQDQLRTYAEILGIPMRVAADADELHATLKGLRDRKLVLIDTAGMSQRDVRLTEQFATLRGASSRVRSYLVLSSTAQAAVLDEAVRAFGRAELQGCILTKVDEAATLGAPLSTILQHNLPLAYVADGQRVPEDMHVARAQTVIERAVTLMQQTDESHDEETLALAFGGMAANVRI
jgi:flagellar biosynthesis protein FlhF